MITFEVRESMVWIYKYIFLSNKHGAISLVRIYEVTTLIEVIEVEKMMNVER